MQNFPLKQLIFSCFLLIAVNTRSQSNLEDWLLLGVETADEILSRYANPLGEGLTYAVSGGWYNTAVVDDAWTVHLGLVTNGSFVPANKKFFNLDTAEYEELTTDLGEAVVSLPTALGGGDFDTAILVAIIDGEEYDFEAPAGMALLNLNLLPSVFLQGKVALPAGTAVTARYFPKLELTEGFRVGLFGLGAQHEFSRWIGGLKDSKVAFSLFTGFTGLRADYGLGASEAVSGENQEITLDVDTWILELVGSTKFKVLNFYAGIGYINGFSRIQMLGNYEIDILIDTLEFVDPIDFNDTTNNIRANLGARLTLGWFGINAAYTFQGFNNISVGLDFRLN